VEASSQTLAQLTSLPELWLGLPSDMLTEQVIFRGNILSAAVKMQKSNKPCNDDIQKDRCYTF
jgi:hypothetical protein